MKIRPYFSIGISRRLASFCLLFLLVTSGATAEQWRLVGITGAQTDDTQTVPGIFDHPDHTLVEINHYNGAVNSLFQVVWVNDSQAVGYCPTNNLVYHTGGASAYSNNSQRNGHDQGLPDVPGVGYQDSQFMESINLATRAAVGIFNADPCPNPDNPSNDIGSDGLFEPCFGLPAPVPSWVLPQYRRDSTMTDGSHRLDGTNEYHAARGLAWSTTHNCFFVSDELGIFKLTTTGDSIKLTNRPTFVVAGDTVTNTVNNDAKGIAFVNVGGTNKLLVGSRLDNSPSGNTNGFIIEVDPESGNVLSQLALNYPPGGADPIDQFGGLLGLAQHPVTKVLYGIRKTDSAFARELVTIDLATGNTTLVGTMGLHITSLAFVPTVAAPHIDSIARNGNNLTISWSGGSSPYQLQTRSSLTGGSWANLGGATTQSSVTITNAITGSAGFFRVGGQ